jgi:formamidopyrimidine-DNA glycosylase
VPELPDVTVYLEALEPRVLNQRLEHIRLNSPFLLRTVTPSPADCEGQDIVSVRRVGKRICLGCANGNWLVIHLMIAGRLHWKKPQVKLAARRDLAAFDFASGTLTFSEAGTERRASLHIVHGEEGLRGLDPGGLDPLTCPPEEFAARLTQRNHTLKRALTDPTLFSGIGNAYSDEILHRARLSPVALTQKLGATEVVRLHTAVRDTLLEWTGRLRQDAGDRFPEGVTAFRPEMAVHGKFGQPCPVCGAKVQRIRYAANETNYCARCQTGGRVLADRALSRLLGADFSRTLSEE